ncbi:MAG TPA: IS4 family transposase, partial [Longimicrobiales bacterium]|nr:IS4 family transposase [Longimicrobiales bacterium]
MSHQDQPCPVVINHQTIKQVIDWLLQPTVFAHLSGGKMATWQPRMLAAAAVLWATSELSTLHARFVQARKIITKVFRWRPAPGVSYQGFLKMLGQWQDELLAAVVPQLRTQMQEVLPAQWETAGYVVFAGDGSRVALTRSESLEAAFAPARRRRKVARRKKRAVARRSPKKQAAAARHKKATSPQLWLTLLWHVGSGLPWAWRTGPSGASERDHLVAMVPELPAQALLVADAGFVGYEVWQALLTAGHHFVIRVGANVRLLRQLGWTREYAHVVYLWPDQAAQKQQPPLVLRLVVVQDGKQPVYLVTDLPKSRLSDRQVATIYGARWGVEVFFRTFKQTFGCRKLRSRSARNAQLELEWSLVGLWGVCLLGSRELHASGQEPTRLSPAAALQAFHGTLREYRVRPETQADTLWAQLRLAHRDDYQRRSAKTSRAYPRKKHRPPIGIPQITRATPHQIVLAHA